MFQRILVPLDGSQRAAQAIPVAAHLARAREGSLLLGRVIDLLHEFHLYAAVVNTSLQAALEKERRTAVAYLEEMAASSELGGMKVKTMVLTGQAAPVILQVAQQERVDLIVFCSHGSTRITRWALGSVAQKVARARQVPLLLSREHHLTFQGKLAHPIRALVALDGSPFAEAALHPAAQLVAAFSAPAEGALHLVRMVKQPTFEEECAYRDLGFDLKLREAVRERAEGYLQATGEKLRALIPAVRIAWTVEEAEESTDAILRLAASEPGAGSHEASDLIALTTHGRSGFQRWRLGSVTERVLQGSTLTLFIVRP